MIRIHSRALGKREGYLGVRLRLLTAEEGGRRFGIADGQRASWNFEADRETKPLVVHNAPLLIERTARLRPGMKLLSGFIQCTRSSGQWSSRAKLTMREGRRIVGEPEIVEKVGPISTRE